MAPASWPVKRRTVTGVNMSWSITAGKARDEAVRRGEHVFVPVGLRGLIVLRLQLAHRSKLAGIAIRTCRLPPPPGKTGIGRDFCEAPSGPLPINGLIPFQATLYALFLSPFFLVEEVVRRTDQTAAGVGQSAGRK